MCHWCRAFVKTLGVFGVKIINTLLLLGVILSNLTGTVLAQHDNRQVSQSNKYADSFGLVVEDQPLSIAHPQRERAERSMDSSLDSNLDESTIISVGRNYSDNAGLDIAAPENHLPNMEYLYQTNSCVQPPAGLIDWWTADGDWNDIIGGHHGTPHAGATFEPGMVGQAFSFDGIDDYIDLGNWFTYQDFTITMWVKPGSTQNTYADIMDNNHSNVNWVLQQNGGVTNQYGWGQAFNLTANQWQHLVIIHDSNGNFREYLNGNLSGSSTRGAINYVNPYLFFGRWGGGWRYWKGLLDEVDVYNRALSEAEVASLFNAGTAGKCFDQSIVSTSSESIIANDVDTATIDIILKDSNGNLLPNHTVSLTASGDGNTFVGSSSGQTDVNGSVTFLLKSTRAEEKTVTIIDQTQGIILHSKPAFTFVAGLVSPQNSTITTDLTGVTNDGIASATITVTALDAYNNPIPGATVDINANGSSILAQSSTTTDSQGMVTASIRDATPELVTVSAVINNVQMLQPVDVRFHCQINGDLVVINGDVCRLTAGTYTFDSITVQTGGSLILQGNASLGQGVEINVNSLTIEANGILTADGQGYPANSGPGGGPNLSLGGGSTGGGHGGQGGIGNSNAGGGASYGDLYNPITLGSGGGSGSNGGYGGTGGGAIHLIVNSVMTLNGVISANGLNGGTFWGAGAGGAGGSVWISANSLIGNGQIRVNGGLGHNWNGYAGGGGGGRIAIYTNALSSAIQLSANGGSGYQNGGTGTIYLDGVDPSLSTLTVTPSSIIADGTSTATITVTLKNADGIPVPNQTVELAIASGEGLIIGTTYALVDEYVPIGVTNMNGIVTASLKTIRTGERTFKVRVGQILLDSPGTAVFTPGELYLPASLVYIPVNSVPANGQTPITVVVTALDKNNNPIPDADVSITTNSSTATITQPGLTDAQGKATGTLVNTVSEIVNISVSVNGTHLTTEGVVFYGADMSLRMSGMSILTAGSDIQYYVSVTNENGLPLQNVNLQVLLPSSVAYINNSLLISPAQNGQTLSWNLGDLAYGETVAFSIAGRANTSLTVGSTLVAQASVTSDTVEESLVNNTTTVNSAVVDGHNYTASISPSVATVSSNVKAGYSVLVENTGLLADEFTITVNDLDTNWYTLAASNLRLGPGERQYVALEIQASGCIATGSIPFSVSVANSQTNIVLSAQVNFQSGPILSEFYPANGVVVSSTDVLFNWRSDTETTGILTVYPAGQPQGAVTYPSNQSALHSVIVNGLKTGTTYEWYVQATSECGVTNTSPQQFKIEKGVVFSDHTLAHTIDRDYEQIKMVTIKNIDSVSHTVGLEIEDVYEDLIVNFRGSGSFEHEIVLLPGETRQVELIYFAQDTLKDSYDITAKLTSTDGAQTITDFATIHLNVSFVENYTVEEIGMHPTLHVMQYRITNHGSPITDLSILAVDRLTGLPAPVILVPQIYHARLGRGEILEFVTMPQYSPNEVANLDSPTSSFGVFASLSQYQSLNNLFNIVADVNGRRTVVVNSSFFHCDAQIYAVTYDGPMIFTTPVSAWYCPNNPKIVMEFFINLFYTMLDMITGGRVNLSFVPSAASVKHSLSVSLNGTPLASIDNSIPNGEYGFDFGPEAINKGIGINPKQRLEIKTTFPYGSKDDAHYIISTGGKVSSAVNGLTIYICATSLDEARAIAEELLNVHPAPTSLNLQIEVPNPGTTVSPDANGFVNIKAFVGDNRNVYYNDYTVKAEITYLDQANTPTDTFFLFDDGGAGHKDTLKNDRYFNALWSPRFGGQVRLKVTATAVNGLTDTAERTFFVDARPDFEVKRVFIEKITREGDPVEVKAEITNNGFSVTGPVTVKFNYYNTDEDGNKIGVPIWTSELELFGTFLDEIFDHGQITTVRDTSFVAPDVDIFYVEVIVDPH